MLPARTLTGVFIALFIVNVVLATIIIHPSFRITTNSDSMQPTINGPAVVYCTPVILNETRVGDIIAFRTPWTGQSHIHRVHRLNRSNRSFQPKGDNRASPDPWHPASSVQCQHQRHAHIPGPFDRVEELLF